MSSHRYQRVDTSNDDDGDDHHQPNHPIPASPPPSFHSRASSPVSRHILSQDPLATDADQTLTDTFGADDDGHSTDAEDEADDRQRLMRGNNDGNSHGERDDAAQLRNEGQSSSAHQGNLGFVPSSSRPPVTAPSTVIRGNDGVFANLAAKPERGEKTEDLPPTYEQAAADATPPYWETTIVAPGMSSDEVYVDGLPVGSIFSFVWNGMISTSFQLVGFLLTYLLHTTHAAKNGSRAGLGLTLVQYGFYMKPSGDSGSSATGASQYVPPDPNSHDFDPGSVGSSGNNGANSSAAPSGITTSEWFAYVLMVVGWFILIRAISDFLRARRHEQLVLQSPERGLPVPIVSEGEHPERAV